MKMLTARKFMVNATCVSSARGISAIVLACVMFSLLSSSPVFAQSFGAGLTRYQQGDFQGSLRSLNKALKVKAPRKTEANIHKLIGMNSYMLGRRGQAAKSFRRALSLNPQLTMKPAEVLDKGVLALFYAQKNAGKKNSSRVSVTKSRTGRKPATLLVVSSNVKSASVLIGGILSGSVGDRIEVNPGAATVSLTARGYTPRVLRVNIRAHKINQLSIDLKKKAIRKKRNVTPPVNLVKKDKKYQKKRGKKSPSKAKDLFGDMGNDDNLPSIADQNLQYQTRPRIPQSQQLPPGYGSGGYAPYGAVGAQPAMPQQAYPQQAYPNPYATTPPPGYGAYGSPYGGQQPYGQPYPQPYGQPYGQQYAQPYGQAPVDSIPGPPSPLPSQTTPAPQYYGDGGNSRPGRRGNRVAGRMEKTYDKSTGVTMALLPFGAGQFYNGNTVLGSIFAVGQAASLGSAIYFYMDISSYADQAKAAEASAVAQGRTQAEIQAFRQEAEAYLSDQQSMQNYATIAFFGLWAASSIEAIVNPPTNRRLGAYTPEEGHGHQIALAAIQGLRIEDPGNFAVSDATARIAYSSQAKERNLTSWHWRPTSAFESSTSRLRYGVQVDWVFE